ncbi:hypothetical protein [Nocardia sp. CC227C]|uniref:hypothetical protein n=1 Tax=Nocardia sp. CC227C TaxID=3044562 RepID=UPI00278BCE03|nr:hypothetical protein [Nocardia sp. CC227C]
MICAVVGHPARIVQATDLARSIGGVLALDDGRGPEANHLAAWHATAHRPASWSCVLEDDALPVTGFTEQAEIALAAAPTPVVSFYLGKGMPPRWQHRIHGALQLADRETAHWITTSHVLHAVAVAIRTELVADWLDWAPDSKLPADERLSAWCKTRGHRVAYTVPSLVEHADGPTVMRHRDQQPRTVPRIAWRTGTRETWNSKAVSM